MILIKFYFKFISNMKSYVRFLFLLFISFSILANDNIASQNNTNALTSNAGIQEKNSTDTDVQEEIEILKSEVLKLTTKTNVLENEISSLSTQVKNAMQLFESNNKNLASNNFQKSSINKNYEEEKKDYDLAFIALKDGDYTIAEQRFAKFIEEYPDSSLLSNVYFWHGELYYRQKNYEKAGVYFLNGYKKFPRGIKASDSLLKLSLSLGNLDKGNESCKIIAKLQKEFKERSSSSIQKEKEILEKYNCQQ